MKKTAGFYYRSGYEVSGGGLVWQPVKGTSWCREAGSFFSGPVWFAVLFCCIFLGPSIGTVSALTPAYMLNPAPGSILPTNTARFQWQSVGADSYSLYLGSGQGKYDIRYLPCRQQTSVMVEALPEDGAVLWARLHSKIDGVWQYRDYQYVACSNPAKISSPTSGSTILTTKAYFQWQSVGADSYSLYLGSSQGKYDIRYLPCRQQTSVMVEALPEDGSVLWARLHSKIGGVWQYRDYQYIACFHPAKLSAPTPGSTIITIKAYFQWQSVGADSYSLYLGSSQGKYDIRYLPCRQQTSVLVEGLSEGDSVLWARLHSKIGGVWQYRDYQYILSIGPAKILTPSPGSVMQSSHATFHWEDIKASAYSLYLGYTKGKTEIGYYPCQTRTSVTLPLPATKNRTVWLRLNSKIYGVWKYRDYQYILNNPAAVLFQPAPDTELVSSTVRFWWSETPSTYRLEIGSQPGLNNYCNLLTDKTAAIVSNLPVDGSDVYVKLSTILDAETFSRSYHFTAYQQQTFADEEAEIDYLWNRNIVPILRDIDITNGQYLYDAQQYLMLPGFAALLLKETDKLDQLLAGLTQSIRSLPTLYELRERHKLGEIVIDDYLLDESRSGRYDRKVFPTKNASGVVYNGINNVLQYSYLLSFMAKEVAGSRPYNMLSEVQKDFCNEVIRYLNDDLISPLSYYTEVDHYIGPFPNWVDRLEAKISADASGRMDERKYYRAISDYDLHFLAIISDLMCINRKSDHDFNLNDELIADIVDLTKSIFEQRISTHHVFVFDEGRWDDHPDHAYAGYYGETLPTEKSPKENSVQNTSHAHRWPWWLQSFRDAYAPTTSQWVYYDALITNLAEQLETRVVQFTPDGPLLKNFLDGSNGWYRVNYHADQFPWGYGPYTLSATAKFGSWYLLSERSDYLLQFTEHMQSMIVSTDPNSVTHRILYFGERDYDHPPLDETGLRSVDLFGRNSIYYLYLLLYKQTSVAGTEIK